MEWLLEDAVNSGDVAYASRLVHAFSMYSLHQTNPDLYRLLVSVMKRTHETQELRNSPKQIGQLVAKQDNNYLMGEIQTAQLLQLLQNKKKSDQQ
ncbi:MAG: hypothetical protein J5616_00915 [Bacteroidaceae bacterium]|nr:hypothetical protein [Bacteroidaceae bacterium]